MAISNVQPLVAPPAGHVYGPQPFGGSGIEGRNSNNFGSPTALNFGEASPIAFNYGDDLPMSGSQESPSSPGDMPPNLQNLIMELIGMFQTLLQMFEKLFGNNEASGDGSGSGAGSGDASTKSAGSGSSTKSAGNTGGSSSAGGDYEGKWGGEDATLREINDNNVGEGLQEGEKNVLITVNDTNMSEVEKIAEKSGFEVVASEGDSDSGAILLKAKDGADSEKLAKGMADMLDAGKVTVTAVTADKELKSTGGGKDDKEDTNTMAFGSTDNTNTRGGVIHRDLPGNNEDGVTIWDADNKPEDFRGGWMSLEWT